MHFFFFFVLWECPEAHRACRVKDLPLTGTPLIQLNCRSVLRRKKFWELYQVNTIYKGTGLQLIHTRNNVETVTSDTCSGLHYPAVSPLGVAKERIPLARNNISEPNQNELFLWAITVNVRERYVGTRQLWKTYDEPFHQRMVNTGQLS